KKVKQMITDRTRIAKTDPGHVDICEVPWPMYKVFADDDLQATVKRECESAEIGCVQCKSRLAGVINDTFAPMRERRAKLAADPDHVFKLLEYGSVKARKVAAETLEGVRETMGMVNWNLSAVKR
ncbi:MAG TPA: hypothetical protein V6C72_12935, partial [Chroococcales cyanobacterium]